MSKQWCLMTKADKALDTTKQSTDVSANTCTMKRGRELGGSEGKGAGRVCHLTLLLGVRGQADHPLPCGQHP